jgi:hypothetical protein
MKGDFLVYSILEFECSIAFRTISVASLQAVELIRATAKVLLIVYFSFPICLQTQALPQRDNEGTLIRYLEIRSPQMGLTRRRQFLLFCLYV